MDASSSSSAASSSNASYSGRNSPEITADPSLEQLLGHFTAAKSALASTHDYISDANDLVNHSRALVDELALLNARNEHLRRGIEDGVQVLERVQQGITNKQEDIGDEFREVVEGLDAAHARLQATLDSLRGTPVDADLYHQEDADESLQDSNQPTTLHHFIDASTYEALLADVRSNIDTFHASNDDLTHSLVTFRASIATLNTSLRKSSTHSDPHQQSLYDQPDARSLFTTIEHHATSIAELLSGLVTHYDLSRTALKHTTGGADAARNLSASPASPSQSLLLPQQQLPLTERSELLSVLTRDASLLPSILEDVESHYNAQQSLHADLLTLVTPARQNATHLRETLILLREMRTLHIPSHSHAYATFAAEWERLRGSLSASQTELIALAVANEGFIAAYGELRKEVARADNVKGQVANLKDEIKELEKEDRETRREFVRVWGGSLPRGLRVGELEE